MGLLTGDTYISTGGGTEYVPYCERVEVTEHRAPTDMSVKLLNEFEEKARENIIAKVEIRENNINAAVIYYMDNFAGNRIEFHIRFKFNGKEYVMRDSVDRFDWNKEVAMKYSGFGSKAVFIAFHERLSKIIAAELMEECSDFTDKLITL